MNREMHPLRSVATRAIAEREHHREQRFEQAVT